ncbi:MAG: RNA-binding transcriptional accessory protein [Blastocatellia bacterium]|nr:RNA-binding transcriptional accessory protein [Blastocatellia bacterium]
MNIPQLLADELSLSLPLLQNVLTLFSEGATIPFIARYRKEMTGEMNEIVLRQIEERYEYLTELEERKATILASIEEQGKLTDELRQRIESCLNKTELEDLYLPYRPKRRTRATIARENGLEPLAEFIRGLNIAGGADVSLAEEALKFVSEDGNVKTVAEALQGASDILAEEVSEKAELRAHIRSYLMEQAVIVSSIKEEFPVGTTKFEMYRDYRAPVKDIAPHNMLALRRGEEEGVLFFNFEFDEGTVLHYLESQELATGAPTIRAFFREMLADAFDRLMKTSLLGEVRLEKKKYADVVSIQNFEANLRELLLSSPAGMKPTLGVDPGFRTGCKVAAVSHTGKFLEYEAIFPHQSANERARAAQTLKRMIAKHNISLIAIGNGTAGRETDAFVVETLAGADPKPIKVMVSEAGASVYSASEVAGSEFPDLDVTVRGAISIARRLQDPLAELVKIDPKSIGVGQYQHDVDQKLLKKKLEDTVESCVNYVGVDLNLASKELLGYVAGINSTVAKNIVAYRDEHGAFNSRAELLKVPKFGPKTFEQASGFLRIRNGKNPLDNSAVHPERYQLVEQIAQDLGVALDSITRVPEKIQTLDIKKYITAEVGEPTLLDIKEELLKPGRDPRAEFRYATFNEDVKEMKDLAVGMILEGTVTNVTNFGAFVDIGVHQDGLVHISQMADKFVDNPTKIVKVGQIVKVRVLEVNIPLKRIGLSMKLSGGTGAPAGKPNQGAKPNAPQQKPKAPEKKQATVADLMAKFNRR